jgi:hypothetical protein
MSYDVYGVCHMTYMAYIVCPISRMSYDVYGVYGVGDSDLGEFVLQLGNLPYRAYDIRHTPYSA